MTDLVLYSHPSKSIFKTQDVPSDTVLHVEGMLFNRFHRVLSPPMNRFQMNTHRRSDFCFDTETRKKQAPQRHSDEAGLQGLIDLKSTRKEQKRLGTPKGSIEGSAPETKSDIDWGHTNAPLLGVWPHIASKRG